jgi:hypothetical protein
MTSHQVFEPGAGAHGAQRDASTRLISLSRGLFTIVDDGDYERVCSRKWSASPSTRTFYAKCKMRVGSRRVDLYLHRFILNAQAGLEVDHVNGNGLDNRRCNLRLATRAENARNRKKPIGGTSASKGVYWCSTRLRWCAKIHVLGKDAHLGYFVNEADAGRAYRAAALEHFGEFAAAQEFAP